jgi:hypothetical protein
MGEELKFEMDYKGEKHGFCYRLDSASEQDVAHAASSALEISNSKGFEYAGFNAAMISKFVSALSAPSASEALSSASASEIRSLLRGSCGELAKLTPAAEAYFFYKLFSKYSLPCLPAKEMFRGSVPMEKTHPSAKIALLAKYKSWVAIKKMSIVTGVEDYEVSGALCAINETLVKKAFDFSQIDLTAIETEAKKLTKGKRKSYSTIAEAISNLPEKGKSDIENAYLLFSILGEFKVRPYAHREMLSKQYPDIKTPKPRGRMPKA